MSPSEQWKLTHTKMANKVEEKCGAPKKAPQNTKCPFTGMAIAVPSSMFESIDRAVSSAKDEDTAAVLDNFLPREGEIQGGEQCHGKLTRNSDSRDCGGPPASSSSVVSESVQQATGIGLSGEMTKTLFPYHVILDTDFSIQQVGSRLPGLLQKSEEYFLGRNVADIFMLQKMEDSMHTGDWSWQWLRMQVNQSFDLQVVHEEASFPSIGFKTSVAFLSDTPFKAILILNLKAKTFDDLQEMNLTLSDLPGHGAQRDLIYTSEHLKCQLDTARTMERLTESLERERTLLESLLPAHAAEGLREGRTVEPMLHSVSVPKRRASISHFLPL